MAGDSKPKSRGTQKPAPGTFAVLVPQDSLAGQPDIPLNRPVTTVGSNETARLHLVSRTVSKGHAIFVNSGGVTYVADLASRTGVLVNGKLIRDVDLKTGDRIQIGKFLFKYRAAANAQIPPAVMPPFASVIVVGKAASPIESRVFQIGRRETSDIPFPTDAAVSAAHAVIFEMDGRWHLRDLGSRTGTLLNNKPVHQQALNFGDRIVIGESTILFQPGAVRVEEVEEPQTIAPPEPVSLREEVLSVAIAAEVDDAIPLASETPTPTRDWSSLIPVEETDPPVGHPIAVEAAAESLPIEELPAANPDEQTTDEILFSDEVPIETVTPETTSVDVSAHSVGATPIEEASVFDATGATPSQSLSAETTAAGSPREPDSVVETTPISAVSHATPPVPPATVVSTPVAPSDDFVYSPAEEHADLDAVPDIIFWGDPELDSVAEQAVIQPSVVKPAMAPRPETLTLPKSQEITQPLVSHSIVPALGLTKIESSPPLSAPTLRITGTPAITPAARIEETSLAVNAGTAVAMTALPPLQHAIQTTAPAIVTLAAVAHAVADLAPQLAVTSTVKITAPPLARSTSATAISLPYIQTAANEPVFGDVAHVSVEALTDHETDTSDDVTVPSITMTRLESPRQPPARQQRDSVVTGWVVHTSSEPSSAAATLSTIQIPLQPIAAVPHEVQSHTSLNAPPVSPSEDFVPDESAVDFDLESVEFASSAADALHSPELAPEVEPFVEPHAAVAMVVADHDPQHDRTSQLVSIAMPRVEPIHTAGVVNGTAVHSSLHEPGAIAADMIGGTAASALAPLETVSHITSAAAVATGLIAGGMIEAMSDHTVHSAHSAGELTNTQVLSPISPRPFASDLIPSPTIEFIPAEVLPDATEDSAEPVSEIDDLLAPDGRKASDQVDLRLYRPRRATDDAGETYAGESFLSELQPLPPPTPDVAIPDELMAFPVEPLDVAIVPRPLPDSFINVVPTAASDTGQSVTDDALDFADFEFVEPDPVPSVTHTPAPPQFSGVSTIDDFRAVEEPAEPVEQIDESPVAKAPALLDEPSGFEIHPEPIVERRVEQPSSPPETTTATGDDISIPDVDLPTSTSDLEFLDFVDEPKTGESNKDDSNKADKTASNTDAAAAEAPATPPTAPEKPASGSAARSGPSIFGFQFDGGSFLGGMPIALAGKAAAPTPAPPAAPPTPSPVFDARANAPAGLGSMAAPPPPSAKPTGRPTTPPRPVRNQPGAPLMPSSLSGLVSDAQGPWANTPVIPPTNRKPLPTPMPGTPPARGLTSNFSATAPVKSADVFSQMTAPIGVEVFGGRPGDPNQFAVPDSKATDTELDADTSVEELPHLPDELVVQPGLAPATAAVITPSRKKRWLRLPFLGLMLLLVPAGLTALVYKFVPVSSQIVGSISFEGLAGQGAMDTAAFRRSQEALIYSDDVRQAATAILDHQGLPEGFTSTYDSYKEIVNSGSLNWDPQTQRTLTLNFNTTNETFGRQQVDAVMTALAQKDRALDEQKNLARADAATAAATKDKSAALIESLKQQRRELASKVDAAPSSAVLSQADDDAAKLKQTWLDAQALRINSEKVLSSLSSEDVNKPVDVEADPEVVTLKKQLQPLLDQIAKIKGVGAIDAASKSIVGTDVAVGATTQPEADANPLLIPLQQQVDDLQARLDHRRSELAEESALGPEQRAINKARAIENLSVKLTSVRQAETDARTAADDAAARDKADHELADTARVAGEQVQSLHNQEQDAGQQNQRDINDSESRETALAKCITVSGEAGPTVSVGPRMDLRPRLAIGGSVGAVFFVGLMILGELRRPKQMAAGATPAAAPRVSPSPKLMPWPQPSELQGLERGPDRSEESEEMLGV